MDVFKRATEENKIVKGISSFVDSPLFAVLFGIVALFFYWINQPVAFLTVFFVCGLWICLFCRDTRAGIPLVLFLVVTRRNQDNQAAYVSKGALILYATLGLMVCVAIVYRAFFRGVRWENKRGLVGILLFVAALLIGGVFSEYYSLDNFIYAISISAYLFGFYIFFGLTLEKREDNLLYLARVCAVVVCVIALEVLEFYLRKYEPGMGLGNEWKNGMILGWTFSNSVGEMMTFLFPALFYLIYKEKYGYLYYFVVLVGLVGIYFTFGRNALLWAFVTVAVGVLVNCFLGKNKKFNRIMVLVIAALGIGLIIWCYALGKLGLVTEFFSKMGLKDRGRFRVWLEHVQLYRQSPLNGVGFQTYAIFGQNADKAHNNILQMLAGGGLVGFFLYLIHRVQTLRLIFKKPTVDRLFIGGCILVSLCMGMLSSAFFHNYSIIYYAVILMVLEKS